MERELILASASDRRSKILAECGISHRVVVSGSDEISDGRSVAEIVVSNAVIKAETVLKKESGAVVIGADTLVVHGNDIIGKPLSENAARELLCKFSGSLIEVYTGMCVIDGMTGKRVRALQTSFLTGIAGKR